MSPWLIVVVCLASPDVCVRTGTPDLGINNYATRGDCERALVEIAKKWDPGRGAYAFTCHRWPW